MTRVSRLAISNTLGTFLEYFDYTLYGFSAPLIAHLFFSTKDRLSSLLLAWGVFFISFLVRPFGAILLGHLGDRLGRRNVLTACILLMGIPTCAIGFLPTYQQIGVLAPVLLMLCRILQGFAISGEFAGCSVYLYETAIRYKGFLASLTTCASGFGMLSASLWIFAFSQFGLSEHLVTNNYWRLPFIVAGLSIAIIGYYLRRSLPETPKFSEFSQHRQALKTPLVAIFKHEPITFVLSVLLAGYTTFVTYTLCVYTASYLTEELHYATEVALLITAAVGLVESLAAPLFAYLSDLYGRVKIMSIGTLGIIMLAIPLFEGLNHGSWQLITLNLCTLAICLATFDGPMMAYVLDQFSVGKRYSALGVSYNLGVALMGGSAPLLLSYLIAKTHNKAMPGIFLTGLATITLTALLSFAFYRKFKFSRVSLA